MRTAGSWSLCPPALARDRHGPHKSRHSAPHSRVDPMRPSSQKTTPQQASSPCPLPRRGHRPETGVRTARRPTPWAATPTPGQRERDFSRPGGPFGAFRYRSPSELTGVGPKSEGATDIPGGRRADTSAW